MEPECVLGSQGVEPEFGGRVCTWDPECGAIGSQSFELESMLGSQNVEPEVGLGSHSVEPKLVARVCTWEPEC